MAYAAASPTTTHPPASRRPPSPAVVENFHNRIKRPLTAQSETAATPASTSPRQLLEVSARQWLMFFASHRDETTVILREARAIDPRFEKGLADLRESAVRFLAGRFKDLQDAGLADPSIHPEFFAHLQLGLFDEVLNAYVLSDTDADLSQLARQLAAFEWSGIRKERP